MVKKFDEKTLNYFEIIELLNNNKISDTKYSHYTSFYSMLKIIESNSFLFGCMKDMNDLYERDRSINSSRTFTLCFSKGKTENLPMWYMYSGLRGKGTRIDFTQAGMRKLIDGITSLVLLERDSSGNLHEIRELRVNVDFTIEYGDVLYFDMTPHDNYYRIKYNNRIYYTPEEEEQMMKRTHFKYSKISPWYYEKEFRIIITLKDSVEIEKESNYKLKLNLTTEIVKMIRIVLGPESGEEDKANFQSTKVGSFKPVEFSELRDYIKMNLIINNFNEIEQYLHDIFNEEQRLRLKRKLNEPFQYS